MADENDWLEERLRAEGEQPVRDEGFTARVMGELPARKGDPRRWIVPAMTVIGGILALALLLDSGPRGIALQQMPGDVLLPFLGVLSLVVGAWALSESR